MLTKHSPRFKKRFTVLSSYYNLNIADKIHSSFHTFELMERDIKFYKRRFRNMLEPVFVMLIHRKAKMSHDEWRNLVSKTLTNIISNPTEFLGTELPDPSIIKEYTELLFADFLSAQSYTKEVSKI